MDAATVDLGPLRRVHAALREAIDFWAAQPDGSALKLHLRSAVIQSFEFTHELALRSLRRVLVERATSADRLADLSFNDLLRSASDAGLIGQPSTWRAWREMRNTTSHAYDETKAQVVAEAATAFVVDAGALIDALAADLTDRA